MFRAEIAWILCAAMAVSAAVQEVDPEQNFSLKQLSIFCQNGYIDFNDVKKINFVQGRANASRGRVIGNGNRLQCRNSPECNLYDVTRATCTRSSMFDPWSCEPNINMEMTNLSIECEAGGGFFASCVLKDSCVVFFDLRRPNIFKKFAWVIGLVAFVVLFGCIIACRIRRSRRNARAAAHTTTTVFAQVPNPTMSYAPGQQTFSPMPAPPPGGQAYSPYLTNQYAPTAAPMGTPSMQPMPPYSGLPQPALNPAFTGDVAHQNTYEAPPPYASPTQNRY